MPVPTVITRDEAIIQAIEARLRANLQGITIYRSRVSAMSKRQAPSLNIARGKNTPSPNPIVTGKIEWELVVNLEFFDNGPVPDRTIAPFIAAAHALVMTDPTYDGLTQGRIWPQPQEPQLDEADATAVWVVCPYVLRYRTLQTDLTTAG
jgi:hypothetical protein